ncbi:uncharacterized protein TRAVEDRAFT_31659 [Trametes versicolor FP-101664 SS1]|uniref:uncharacterized protein n=1 Tax=Trametes versicolor (strain FP-101664) TaxID=717944 RepID=UPI0004624697|nr:uncharacterized protein TRAVEDRAFT_31659 [Trametes versicolor FP-101664 SS1]EIW53576.1 hypothetical protein TRAVEDRAFT_31659 [Trametes versicolor FP-101664 SS1]
MASHHPSSSPYDLQIPSTPHSDPAPWATSVPLFQRLGDPLAPAQSVLQLGSPLDRPSLWERSEHGCPAQILSSRPRRPPRICAHGRHGKPPHGPHTNGMHLSGYR